MILSTTSRHLGGDDSALSDWIDFSRSILALVRGTNWAGWQYTPSSLEDGGGVSGGPGSRDAAGAADKATAGGDAEPAGAPERPSRWQPKPAALLAALRIAKTFGSFEALVSELGTRGSTVLLTTGSVAMERTLLKTLGEIFDSKRPWLDEPKVILAAEALHSSAPDAHQVLAPFSAPIRDAIEQGKPIVMVTAIAGTVPKAVWALRPHIVQLSPLDRTMLFVLLGLAYPDETSANVLATLPDDAALARMRPDALTLALRAPDSAAAVQGLIEMLTPPQTEGLGLAKFPLPDTVREALNQLIADLKAWQDGRLSWENVSRGFLMVGPPGTGKTQVARLVAQEAEVSVLACSLSKWASQGGRGSEVAKAMRADFGMAGELSPCILLLDEIDAFGDRARRPDHNSAYTDYIVSALIDLMDGFEAHEGVVVIGATNHLHKLDRAIVRPGRFDRILQLDHPGVDLVPAAFRWHLGADLTDVDLSEITRPAFGISGADIAAIVRSARSAARSARRDLSPADLSSAIAERCPPLSSALRRRVATHEAGHAVVAVATGCAIPMMLAIQSAGGFTQSTPVMEEHDRRNIEAHLAVNLAGRAAERLMFGGPSAGAGGDPDSDLAKATRLAAAMEASWGLGDTLVWHGSADMVSRRLDEDAEFRSRIEDFLRQAELRALRILEANKGVLNDIAAALDARAVLNRQEVEPFIGSIIPG